MSRKRNSPRHIVVLGSTGSIGVNALDVISRFPDRFRVLGLSAYNNVDMLERQVRAFRPDYVAIGRKSYALLKKRLGSLPCRCLEVEEGISEMVTDARADTVVIGMSGRAALEPFLDAVRCGKTVAPANKEALVIAGELIMAEARKSNAKVIPVDSEQSAIFQCLAAGRRRELRRIYLTASGGALKKVPRSQFADLTVEKILKHPRWKMGRKITVDSATLMNKGFEVIEAQRLFQVGVEDIEVLIHPEAIVHSLISFVDGSIMAQLGVTDMRLPIQYALTYPQRWPSPLPDVDFLALKRLTFEKPQIHKFPALGLALEVAGRGDTYPAVLNAADEEAVAAFLKHKLSFCDIFRTVEHVVLRHQGQRRPGLQDVLSADLWARSEAKEFMRKGARRV